VGEKDLGDDDCEKEMRINMVVTLLLSISYCYLKLHYYAEAQKCLDYAIEIAPIAADAYFRRSQCRTYNRLSTIAELRLAVDDANKAIERRPKDKMYQKHKEHLEHTIQNQIMKQIDFINKLVEKAQS
jgi:tetratricopeptide (TPR) repeat protein